MTATEQVEGETEYIRRGAPGGWSQKRFQQRAENTWEHNGQLLRRLDLTAPHFPRSRTKMAAEA